MKTVALLLALFLVLPLFGCDDDPTAPKVDPDWTTWTPADGLPYDVVTGVTTGPDGSVWFAHAIEGGGGVTHFDGTTFTHYSADDGLASNAILWFGAIAIDDDGVVWIGTGDAGLSRFDGADWTTFTTDDGLASNMIIAVTVAPNGDVWCAGDGVSRLHDGTWTTWTCAELELGPYAFSVVALANGDVWVGGLTMACFDGATWIRREHLLTPAPAGSVAAAPDGSVWVGGNGLTRFRGEHRTHFTLQQLGVTPVEELAVNGIAIDADDVLWAASASGLLRFDGMTWKTFTSGDGLLDDQTLGVAVGSDGAVWVGSQKGLSRYLPVEDDGRRPPIPR